MDMMQVNTAKNMEYLKTRKIQKCKCRIAYDAKKAKT